MSPSIRLNIVLEPKHLASIGVWVFYGYSTLMPGWPAFEVMHTCWLPGSHSHHLLKERQRKRDEA